MFFLKSSPSRAFRIGSWNAAVLAGLLRRLDTENVQAHSRSALQLRRFDSSTSALVNLRLGPVGLQADPAFTFATWPSLPATSCVANMNVESLKQRRSGHFFLGTITFLSWCVNV